MPHIVGDAINCGLATGQHNIHAHTHTNTHIVGAHMTIYLKLH